MFRKKPEIISGTELLVSSLWLRPCRTYYDYDGPVTLTSLMLPDEVIFTPKSKTALQDGGFSADQHRCLERDTRAAICAFPGAITASNTGALDDRDLSGRSGCISALSMCTHRFHDVFWDTSYPLLKALNPLGCAAILRETCAHSSLHNRTAGITQLSAGAP